MPFVVVNHKNTKRLAIVKNSNGTADINVFINPVEYGSWSKFTLSKEMLEKLLKELVK